MANVWAVKTGNWTDTTVWNTGALPTSADDVYSNGFTVTINTSPTVLSIRNSAAAGIDAGGGFITTSNMMLSVTGDGIICGSTGTCLTSNLTTGLSCTINGKVTGGTSTSTYGIRNNGSGILNVNGDVFGGPVFGGNTQVGIRNNGITNIVGSVIGGYSTNTFGVQNFGTLNIIGDVIGGYHSNQSQGIRNDGTANITGNIIGGYVSGNAEGINNTSIINITGNIIGNFSYGIVSSGTLTHIGAIFSSVTTAGIGPGSVSQTTILTGPLISTSGTGVSAAASGVNPCIAARWFPADTALSTFTYTMRGQTISGSPSSRPACVLALPEGYNAAYPSPSDVRSPVPYGPDGIYSGAMVVPDPSSVLPAVPIDNTVGTATLEANPEAFWDVPFSTEFAPGSMGERLKNAASVSSIGDIIAAME